MNAQVKEESKKNPIAQTMLLDLYLHAGTCRRIAGETGTEDNICFIFQIESHWERNQITFKVKSEYLENLK